MLHIHLLKTIFKTCFVCVFMWVWVCKCVKVSVSEGVCQRECVTVHLYGGQRTTCGINSLLPLSGPQGFKLRLLGLVVDMVDASTR